MQIEGYAKSENFLTNEVRIVVLVINNEPIHCANKMSTNRSSAVKPLLE